MFWCVVCCVVLSCVCFTVFFVNYLFVFVLCLVTVCRKVFFFLFH